MAASGGGGAGFTVNRENVLAIGRAFAEEADRLEGNLTGYAQRMVTKPALGDPASGDFAAALNSRLVTDEDSYLNRARAYIAELHRVAERCRASARTYGYTEEQVTATMNGIGERLG